MQTDVSILKLILHRKSLAVPNSKLNLHEINTAICQEIKALIKRKYKRKQ